jgi:hypothetical protein
LRRRSFLQLGGIARAVAGTSPILEPAFQQEPCKLKITGVRIVHVRPRRPARTYTPAPGSWSISNVEVGNPGGSPDYVHFGMATTNSPWAETFMPHPGGPKEVYQRFEEEYMTTHGPEGIYTRASDRPGLRWDIVVS